MGIVISIIKLIFWAIIVLCLPLSIVLRLFNRYRRTHVIRDWEKQQKPIKRKPTNKEKQQKPICATEQKKIKEAIKAKIQLRLAQAQHDKEKQQKPTDPIQQTNTKPEATKTEKTPFQSAADCLIANFTPKQPRTTRRFHIESALGTKRVTAFLRLEYADRDGQITVRDVDVQMFNDDKYGGILAGFCHLRGAFRSFRYDRIQSCTDLETGEVIEDIKKYLNSQ